MPDGTTRDVTLELTPDQMAALNNSDGRHYSMGCNIAEPDEYKYLDPRDIFSDSELEDTISKQLFSTDSKFEVWASQGQGGCFVNKFENLGKAKEYIRYRRREASWLIRPPQGFWHSMARD
jgi:protein subunit release factor B